VPTEPITERNGTSAVNLLEKASPVPEFQGLMGSLRIDKLISSRLARNTEQWWFHRSQRECLIMKWPEVAQKWHPTDQVTRGLLPGIIEGQNFDVPIFIPGIAHHDPAEPGSLGHGELGNARSTGRIACGSDRKSTLPRISEGGPSE